MVLIGKNQNERRSAMNVKVRVFGKTLWAESLMSKALE
jgi:hypothetical protein